MRIGIREQLGLLVLLTTLLSLAVIAIATWINNYDFVINIRSASLSLTASLYAEQLDSALLMLQSSVQAVSSRVLIQQALQRYNDNGNNTVENWARPILDLQSALGGGANAAMLLQARIFGKNSSGVGGAGPLLEATSSAVMGQFPLPYAYANGTQVQLGDAGLGFPPSLYPNLTFNSISTSTSQGSPQAQFNGRQLYQNASLFLGPLMYNQTSGFVSVTVPINNNTSTSETLGWLTVVINAQSTIRIANDTRGLESSGELLIVTPDTADEKLPLIVMDAPGAPVNRTAASTQAVRFLLPPAQDPSRSLRHGSYAYGTPQRSFPMKAFPAVLAAYTGARAFSAMSNSLISTNNEEGEQVSVGYALVSSPMVDWALVVELSHGEVWAPIHHLRNVLIACVFGTLGVVCLFLFPIAHFSVRPIRRLRAATRKTVEAERPCSDGESFRSFSSDRDNSPDFAQGALSPMTEKKADPFARVAFWRNKDHNNKQDLESRRHRHRYRIPGKVQDGKHVVHDELTDLTRTFNEMSEELTMQYARLEERVQERTAELEISKQAAEVANEAKTLFIANISHELKTPLNGVMGLAAVSMQEDDPAKVKRSLGIIYKSGDLLLHLLTDLLTFTKNQIGQQLTLDEREFRLSDVTAQVLSIFDKQAQDGAINLQILYQGPDDSVDTDGQIQPQGGMGPEGTGRIKDMYLWGDQHRILQVLINLVSNSLKFTPKDGQISIRIHCLGEAPERYDPPWRDDERISSMTSKQSKHNSSRFIKKGVLSRVRSTTSSAASSTSRPKDQARYSDTALHINGIEPKPASFSNAPERSQPSKPLGTRMLLFEFEVEDSGPGIPPAQQQKVFEPFMQGDLGLSKKYGGTGLGLSICSQLATLMQGSIKLQSEVGRGSKFTMQIPLGFTKEGLDSRASSLHDAERGSFEMDTISGSASTPAPKLTVKSDLLTPMGPFDNAKQPRLVGFSQPFFAATSPLDESEKQLAAMQHVTAQAGKMGRKIKVLVAEDNAVNQEVVLRMLKLEDIYDVTLATDGQEALDLVKDSMKQKNYFDLILMDVQMPVLDGIQSTKLIREMGYSAPIVALTAFAEESNVKECMDSGMDYFLPKPIRRPALKQVLKRYCPTIPEESEKTSPIREEDSSLSGPDLNGRMDGVERESA